MGDRNEGKEYRAECSRAGLTGYRYIATGLGYRDNWM